jgi:DNA topoisomerase IB
MSRLRRVDCASPGITRRRRGRGFEYLDESTGERIEDDDVVQRIRALAIPPAWEEVWVCADPMGHIQATGMDARARKQYRYHDRWRERRDRRKFEDMLDFARALPDLREQVTRDLRRRKISRERVLACAVRLLDRGFFRIGSEDYAEENETYGIATMRKRHVKVTGDKVFFDYEAKGGKRRMQTIADPTVSRLVKTLQERRGASGAISARPRSTTTSSRRSARNTAPRTSAPGTQRCWRRWCSPAQRANAT